MKVKELADYLKKTPLELSLYCQQKYRIFIPIIESAEIEDNILRKIAPKLYKRDIIKFKQEFTVQAKPKKSKLRTRNFLSSIKQGRLNEAIETISNATDEELTKYGEILSEYILHDEPINVQFWEQICKLMEIKWTVFKKSLLGLVKNRTYFKRLLEERVDSLSNLLVIYFTNSNDILEIADIINAINNNIKLEISNITSLVSSKLHNTSDYDLIIETIQFSWKQMIEFLIQCNSKNSIYVLARNLLNQEVQQSFAWKLPTNKEIREISNRIMEECTVYPEIAYIAQALNDACSRDMESEASNYLEYDSYNLFWNFFYKEKEKELDLLQTDITIKESHIIKAEENYLIVRFGNLIAKIDKKDLFYAPVKDLRSYYKPNDIINDLAIKNFKIEDTDKSHYKTYTITLKSISNWKDKYQTFISKNKNKPIKARILEVVQEGILVSLGPGVESFIKRVNITPIEYDNILHSKSSYPELDVVIDNFDINQKRCNVRSYNNISINELWNNIEQYYKENHIYTGKILSKEKDFLWIELPNGADMKVYKNELYWKNCGASKKAYKESEEIRLLILKIDKKNRKITGSIKSLIPNPWDIAKTAIKTGEICMVKVIDKTDYNLVVETVDTHRLIGQIKKTELSWHQQDENKLPEIGSEFKAKVTLFEPDSFKIRFSVKQLTKDPWIELYIGCKVSGTVTKKVDNEPATIMLSNCLEAKTSDFEPELQEGENYPFKIISYNRTEKAIVLSHREYIFDKQTEIIVKSFFNA